MLRRIILVILCITMVSSILLAERPIWPQAKIFVGEMYLRILGRPGTKESVKNYSVALIKCNIQREDIIKTFFTSAEYINKDKSHAEFMYDVYYSILRRNPAPGEPFGYIRALRNGNLTRSQVIDLFLNSEEYLLQIEQYEDDCMIAENVAFYYVFPDGGYTIQEYCDRIVIDLPELNKFELILKVKGLAHNDPWPFKGQIYFLADAASFGEDWDNSALIRKYGLYPGLEWMANLMKWSYTLSDHYEWEEFLDPDDYDLPAWNPNTIYEFKIVVNGDYNYGVQLWLNGQLLRASAQTVPWTPVDQEIYCGSPSCEWDEGAGYGSIPGATYISIKMIDLED